MSSVHFDFFAFPNKINLGCGFDKRNGYLNIDFNKFHDPDFVGDVLNLDDLPKNHYCEIIAQDILEHLPRCSTKRALLHWSSLLKINGELYLRVPNVIGVCNLLQKKDNHSVSKHEQLIRCLFGTQAYSGDYHYTTFTELVIRSYLEQCGYSISYITERDDWLFDICAIKKTHVNPRDIDDFSDLLEKNSPHEEFVESCYIEILKRNSDSGGLLFYTNEINEGRISREQLISIFTSSPEREG